MQTPILGAALLVALTGGAVAVAAHQQRHQGLAVAVEEVDLVKSGWAGGGLPPGHVHPGPRWWQTTPWHYHPEAPCAPPWCLPAYHRHRGWLADPRALPLEAVLERLKLQDFHSFGPVLLEGANYNIVARNRYGDAVRLIVNAGNGQIRRILQ